MRSSLDASPWQWLGGADNATATLVALTAIVIGFRSVLRRTVIRRRVFSRAVDSMAIGVNAAYVESLFGVPAFGTLNPSGAGQLVYVTPHGYVAVYFQSGRAEQFAFTVTDWRLRYRLKGPTFGVLSGRLGRAGTEALSTPQGVFVSIGARRVWCVETYYAGNPGGYLYYSLAYNDASGVGRFPPAVIASHHSSLATGIFTMYADPQSPPDSDALAMSVHRELVPNTLIVSRSVEHLERQEFGVDLDEVRLLRRNPSLSDRYNWWRLRRRWR
jgi:hypothetical protein